MPQLTPEQHKKQQDAVSAGRNAYRALIPVTGNPYSKQPYRDLWDKGWRIERKKDDAVRPPRDTNRTPFKRPGEFASTAEKRRHDRSVKQRGERRPQEQPPKPVITEKLIERFNRRHQTRA